MANLNDRIENFVCGDSFGVKRYVSGLPSTITKAWMTAKKAATDADNAAVFQKVITTALTADGQIEDAGASGTGLVFFKLTPANTLLLTTTTLFDIQLLLADGTITTPVRGTIRGVSEITIAQS